MSTSPSRMLTGCVLAHPAWYPQVAELFAPRDFGEPVDRKLWETFAEHHAAGHDPSPLDALQALESVEGGGKALGKLTQLMALCEHETPASFGRRVDAVISDVQNKRAIRGLKKLQQAADEGIAVSWPDTLEVFAAKMRRVDKRSSHFTPLTFARFEETASSKRRKVIIPTGYAGIDEMISGFVVCETTAICARTNAGKSSFLAGLALNQFFAAAARHPERLREMDKSCDPFTTRVTRQHAQHGKTGERPPYVLLLTVEDSLDDYLGRFVCNLCDIDGKDYMEDPEHAVYGNELRERFDEIGHGLTDEGRLTITDYEHAEGDDEKTIGQIEKTILGWVQAVTDKHADDEQGLPPLLVLLDYFQKIELPEEDGKFTPEVRLLKKASSKLHKMAKRHHFALAMAVMLLRGPDSVEPDLNDARGGSDIIQDAEVGLTIWPFGASERAAFEKQMQSAGQPSAPAADDSFDTMLAEENEEVFHDIAGEDEFDEADVKTLRRANEELLITGHKGRHTKAGWQAPLAFNRAKKRITDAYDRKRIYRYDPSVVSVLKEHRKLTNEHRKR